MFVKTNLPKTHLAPKPGRNDLQCVAKPFLKWVGGKTQLVGQLDSNAPPELKNGSIDTYVEPFVGGGSFFFHVAQNYGLKKLIIADSNQDLILAYWTIRNQVDALIDMLEAIQARYISLTDTKRQDFYYQTREAFNDKLFCIDVQNYSQEWIERTAQLIFLNKTCFNGLFRVNAAGLFNVAFGRYENPKICDPSNLRAVSKVLEKTSILLGDFTCVKSQLNSNTFAYLDPPYRPLTATSNFTSYSPNTFTDTDQQRLAAFCLEANQIGAKLMISNSDPDNLGATDSYFQDSYPGFRIVRTLANRMVNCKADRRGKISELIIMNYPSQSQRSAAKSAAQSKAALPRRSGAALGAFRLLRDCAEARKSFSMEDLQQATGWKVQTARTYVSKKWKNYLEPEDKAKPGFFKVRENFLELDEQTFLNEFSQVLSAKSTAPQNLEEAKEQALKALSTYANMLGSSNFAAAESQVRSLIEQLNFPPGG